MLTDRFPDQKIGVVTVSSPFQLSFSRFGKAAYISESYLKSKAMAG